MPEVSIKFSIRKTPSSIFYQNKEKINPNKIIIFNTLQEFNEQNFIDIVVKFNKNVEITFLRDKHQPNCLNFQWNTSN